MVIDQAQITTIAIRKDSRGYGLGQLLLKYVMDYASHSIFTFTSKLKTQISINMLRNYIIYPNFQTHHFT
jgi:GNAT superfamily N-acetyltransferase